MGTWSIGLLCFKVFVVIEIESIAQAPETRPLSPPLMIHPQAFKERKKDALYILVGGRHLVFQTERGTKLLFSVSEAYSSLVSKNNRGLWHEWTWIHTLSMWASQLTQRKEKKILIFLCYAVWVNDTDEIDFHGIILWKYLFLAIPAN